MKEKLKKPFIYFACYLLPLSWISGFVRVMLQRYEPVNTNSFLYACTLAVLLAVNFYAWFIMRPQDVKRWYLIGYIIVALGVFLLSLWVYEL